MKSSSRFHLAQQVHFSRLSLNAMLRFKNTTTQNKLVFGQTGITFSGHFMNKVALFHHHFCVGFDTWYKRLYLNESVTECIVCVPGHDPLIFSFLSISFLIGWEFYGPNYLKC